MLMASITVLTLVDKPNKVMNVLDEKIFTVPIIHCSKHIIHISWLHCCTQLLVQLQLIIA